ncbi:MAG: TfoX-like protein [Hydrocarboniphaga sp.]|nr:TfoX-like protein [Hydrocarboniphaga sp.]
MSAFVETLHDVFAEFGAINTRRMFGGHGIYRDGLMFGLVQDDVLYLKADAQNQASFTEAGLEAFQYEQKGRRVRLSYFKAPPAILDSPSEAAVWARRSSEAAFRTRPPTRR